MKWHFTLLIHAVSVLFLAGCGGQAKTVTRISLDFPHGELRLLVRRDSETHLFYGALPTSRTIPSGVFDIDEVYTQLQPRLHKVVPSEVRPLGRPYGLATVEFSNGSSRDYLLYDDDFAGELFKKACQHKVDKTDSSEALFEQVCAIILGATP